MCVFIESLYARTSGSINTRWQEVQATLAHRCHDLCFVPVNGPSDSENMCCSACNSRIHVSICVVCLLSETAAGSLKDVYVLCVCSHVTF
jgi:hypothetical protein